VASLHSKQSLFEVDITERLKETRETHLSTKPVIEHPMHVKIEFSKPIKKAFPLKSPKLSRIQNADPKSSLLDDKSQAYIAQLVVFAGINQWNEKQKGNLHCRKPLGFYFDSTGKHSNTIGKDYKE